MSYLSPSDLAHEAKLTRQKELEPSFEPDHEIITRRTNLKTINMSLANQLRARLPGLSQEALETKSFNSEEFYHAPPLLSIQATAGEPRALTVHPTLSFLLDPVIDPMVTPAAQGLPKWLENAERITEQATKLLRVKRPAEFQAELAEDPQGKVNISFSLSLSSFCSLDQFLSLIIIFIYLIPLCVCVQRAILTRLSSASLKGSLWLDLRNSRL